MYPSVDGRVNTSIVWRRRLRLIIDHLRVLRRDPPALAQSRDRPPLAPAGAAPLWRCSQGADRTCGKAGNLARTRRGGVRGREEGCGRWIRPAGKPRTYCTCDAATPSIDYCMDFLSGGRPQLPRPPSPLRRPSRTCGGHPPASVVPLCPSDLSQPDCIAMDAGGRYGVGLSRSRRNVRFTRAPQASRHPPPSREPALLRPAGGRP